MFGFKICNWLTFHMEVVWGQSHSRIKNYALLRNLVYLPRWKSWTNTRSTVPHQDREIPCSRQKRQTQPNSTMYLYTNIFRSFWDLYIPIFRYLSLVRLWRSLTVIWLLRCLKPTIKCKFSCTLLLVVGLQPPT